MPVEALEDYFFPFFFFHFSLQSVNVLFSERLFVMDYLPWYRYKSVLGGCRSVTQSGMSCGTFSFELHTRTPYLWLVMLHTPIERAISHKNYIFFIASRFRRISHTMSYVFYENLIFDCHQRKRRWDKTFSLSTWVVTGQINKGTSL